MSLAFSLPLKAANRFIMMDNDNDKIIIIIIIIIINIVIIFARLDAGGGHELGVLVALEGREQVGQARRDERRPEGFYCYIKYYYYHYYYHYYYYIQHL